jgi:transcriptional regulator with XRE-family HTH domain
MADIRAIRTELGLTQGEFAAKLGLHQTTISRLETGELPLDARTTLAIEMLQAKGRQAPADQADAA